jgi:hypothetical protein
LPRCSQQLSALSPKFEYDSNPAHLTTGVYITAFLAGGAQAHVTVYGMTVASLAPLVEYSL